MHRFLLILGAVCALILCPVSSWAQTSDSDEETSEEASYPRWYTVSGAGFKSLDQLELSGAQTLTANDIGDTEVDYNAIGAEISPRWRLELALENAFGASFSLNDTDRFRSRSVSALIFRDFPNASSYTPFIGAGLGLSDAKLDLRQPGQQFEGKDQGLSWSLRAGFNAPLSENVSTSTWLQVQGHPEYRFGGLDAARSTQVMVMTGLVYRWGGGGSSETGRSAPLQRPCQILDKVFEVAENKQRGIELEDDQLYPEAVDEDEAEYDACQQPVQFLVSEASGLDQTGAFFDYRADKDSLFIENSLKGTHEAYGIKFKAYPNASGEVVLPYRSVNRTRNIKIEVKPKNDPHIPVADNAIIPTRNGKGTATIVVAELLDNDCDPDTKPCPTGGQDEAQTPEPYLGPALSNDLDHLAVTDVRAQPDDHDKITVTFDRALGTATVECKDCLNLGAQGPNRQQYILNYDLKEIGTADKIDALFGDGGVKTVTGKIDLKIDEETCRPRPDVQLCATVVAGYDRSLGGNRLADRDKFLDMVFFKYNQTDPITSRFDSTDASNTYFGMQYVIKKLNHLHQACGIRTITLVGHADEDPTSKDGKDINEKRAKERAETVHERIEKGLGINTGDRMNFVNMYSHGLREPAHLVKTSTPEILNRRVEIYSQLCPMN